MNVSLNADREARFNSRSVKARPFQRQHSQSIELQGSDESESEDGLNSTMVRSEKNFLFRTDFWVGSSFKQETHKAR
jgi:hypothetical protein